MHIKTSIFFDHEYVVLYYSNSSQQKCIAWLKQMVFFHISENKDNQYYILEIYVH